MFRNPLLSSSTEVQRREQGNSGKQCEASLIHERAPLTDFRYGSHCGVERGADVADYLQTGLSSANTLSHPYHVRFGGKQPDGVERYSMYGMGPSRRDRAPEYEGLPAPGPAALGQHAGDAFSSAVSPRSDTQLVAVIEERFAQTVDPGTVSVEAHEGVVTLRGTVHDAATREVLETEARACPGIKAVHSELSTRTGLKDQA
ncbi:BON domain-containing protein [Cupriavidus sp. BIS7]|uniref:BON domain-containing protein n=1 Tax=Cupriavidus sp. BIS7 TaxID=1217718 RepID=UPI000373D1DF|nr:BON domain-containing protein [Cupriavidus sp. BIS7]